MSEEKRGSNGGNARKEKLTPEQRSSIAQLAAQRRWGKKNDNGTGATATVTTPDNVIPVNIVSDRDVYISNPTFALESNHCPACAMGQSLEKGEGTHVLATVEHPVMTDPVPAIPIPTAQPVIAPQTQRKRSSKPMPKAFKGASSYAEKRLAEAIKERAEYMGRVAALNAEIPSLVSVIRALGTSVIPPEALQSYPMQQPTYTQPSYHVADQTPNLQNPIDTALYQANSGPLPGLVPAAANAPMMPNTSVGGAMDLDYVPTDDEGPGLPKMGNGWV